MRLIPFITLLSVLLSSSLHAQIGREDESQLYAQTKQINQFFRRFNGEESEKGERYYPKDKAYRSEKLRKQYLGILFDASNTGLKPDLKTQFAKDVLDKKLLLSFHGGQWFSEVQATFTIQGKQHTVTLFMELEKDHEGSKWVISKAHSNYFENYFQRDTTKIGQFLHPLSHELAFMNLRKAFNVQDSVNQLAIKRFKPDHLSLLLYELKRGNIKFRHVEEVKFHFFQLPGWYFELSEFNREGYNRGWLISNLVKINNDSEKNLLQKHLYYEK